MDERWKNYLTIDNYHKWRKNLFDAYAKYENKTTSDSFYDIYIIKTAVMFLPFYLKYLAKVKSFKDLLKEMSYIFLSADLNNCIEPERTMIYALRKMNSTRTIEFIFDVCNSYKAYNEFLPLFLMDSSDYYRVCFYLISELNND